jgi:hypothetical protein
MSDGKSDRESYHHPICMQIVQRIGCENVRVDGPLNASKTIVSLPGLHQQMVNPTLPSIRASRSCTCTSAPWPRAACPTWSSLTRRRLRCQRESFYHAQSHNNKLEGIRNTKRILLMILRRNQNLIATISEDKSVGSDSANVVPNI